MARPWWHVQLPLCMLFWAAFTVQSAQAQKRGVTNFVVVTAKRSGARWMIDMLHNHPNIEAGTELLRNKNPVKSLPPAEAFSVINSFYKGMMAKEIVARKKHVLARGFKVMGMFQWGGFAEMFAEYNVKVIFLWRRNKVRQMISNEAVHHGKQAHPETEQQVAKVRSFKVELPIGEAFDEKMHFWNKERAAAQKQYGRFESITVNYEDIASTGPDCQDEWARILRFLKVPQQPLVTRFHPIHLFMRMEDTISNWPEVQRHMQSKQEYKYLLDICKAESDAPRTVNSICGGVPVVLDVTPGIHGETLSEAFKKTPGAQIPESLLEGHHPPDAGHHPPPPRAPAPGVATATTTAPLLFP